MNRFRYIGSQKGLINCTALGILKDVIFKVQVNEFIHWWSHGWHETNIKEWELIPWEIKCH